MEIGYVGLGSMGGALARRLLKTHRIHVWDINPASRDSFERAGALPTTSAADLARKCDVIMMCLPRSSNVRQALFGKDGVGEGLTAGKLVIDQTSGDPSETAEMSDQLAQRSVTMIDAPVSGGVSGAEAGTIAIMVGGPRAAFERALPVLNAISPNVEHCSERVGGGHALKCINNTMSSATRLATLEVVAVGKKMGLSLKTMIDVINKGSGRNKTSKDMLPAVLEGRKALGDMFMPLIVKDINLATGLGAQLGVPMILGNLDGSVYQMADNMLGEKALLAHILQVVETMAGIRLADVDPKEDSSD